LAAATIEEWVRADEKCAGTQLVDRLENGIEIAFCHGMENMQLQPH
jgi:hypothetical protein